jgi:lysophospholipase L1-like esterase
MPRPAGRPAIVFIGDAGVELASHSLTAESVRHERSPPLASELLVNEGPAIPILEQGPGWLSLVARDYAWRCTADVINRGYSGYTTRMALADLDETVATLPVSRADDVISVFLQFGCADCSAAEDMAVPVPEFSTNLAGLVRSLQARLPSSKLTIMTPPMVVDAKVEEACRRRGVPVRGVTLQGVRKYAEAARSVAKSCGVSLVDVFTGMGTRLPHFNDALGPSGRHLAQKGNNFVYRMLKEHLADELKMGPRELPPHRPSAHVAAYGPDGCDQDAKPRKARRS